MEIHTVVTLNRIWKIRLADVGIITSKMIEAYALSGIIIRASNMKKDLRLLGYELYALLSWGVPTATTGDCLASSKIRSPDYYNFQALNILSYCYQLADLISILGTIDFVLGSVDRGLLYKSSNTYFMYFILHKLYVYAIWIYILIPALASLARLIGIVSFVKLTQIY